ncbi:MAG: GNAT family N-acetyltransferase, partial [Clostridia bacterium]|nr:GNAT family N-acetyltransferase [Clostridia bacterium]
MKKLIPDAYRNGEVFSTLYPFSHAFYRKFGYETVCWRNNYEFAPSVLNGYRFDGTAALWKPGDPVSAYTGLYNRFAAGYNLAMRRDDKMMLEKHLKGEYYKDRKFGYLLREQGEPVAYLIFQDVRHDPGAILSVEDLAWEGRTGFNALLGFLARFTADYGTIRMFLPSSLQLFSFIRSPQAYDIAQTVTQGYMIRPINVKRML